MKMVYRGSHPAPKHEHGDVLSVFGSKGVVQHRSFENGRWRYGVLVETQAAGTQLLWRDE